MATHYFGGSVTTTSSTGYPSSAGIYHDGESFPTARACADGSTPIYIGAVRVNQASGAGGISVYSSRGGYQSSSGGTHRVGIDYSSGTLSFGRNNAGGGVVYDTGDNTTWPGSLPGNLDYAQAPNQPTALSATPHATIPGRVDLAWTTPSSNGDSGITNYRVEYSLSPTFASGVTAVSVGSSATSFSVTGLTPGLTYYFRVAARNAVTDTFGKYSVFSGAASALVKSGVKVWGPASTWLPTSVRVWDGAAWVPASSIRVWNGAAWVAAV